MRLRWGFLDERLPAPWALRDELRLHGLKEQACARQLPMEVVLGTAPGWEDPWSRARKVLARKDATGQWTWLWDERGPVDDLDIQRARLVEPASAGYFRS